MLKWFNDFLIEYIKHAVLNLGQALQGIRYIYSHPKVDKIFDRGSLGHFLFSFVMRAKLILNDLFFSILPPHWHHSPDEIKSFHGTSLLKWFQYGYCAWRFSDSGALKTLDGTEDKRWDPRCDD